MGGITARAIQRKTSVRSSSSSDVVEVTATDGDPMRARDIAAAVIDSYIENRRRSAVAGLERAAKDIDERLEPLRAPLADFDARIAALPSADRRPTPAAGRSGANVMRRPSSTSRSRPVARSSRSTSTSDGEVRRSSPRRRRPPPGEPAPGP